MGFMNTALGKVLISSEQIQARISDIGRQISQDYAGKSLTIVAILKGSFIFTSDLIRQIDSEIPVEIDFMAVSSYGSHTTSSGVIKIEKDVEVDIKGRDVIIVEDIVDTGLTLQHVRGLLSERGARSLRTATLLEKPGNSRHEQKVDYIGFQIDNHFVVGYGLDYAQRYRNLPDIRILNEI
jgi:hypoxanthine phosphoribosyltransferase